MADTKRPLEVGDAVKRRGPFPAVGAVIDKRDHWVSVRWPKGAAMPTICDERELELVAV